MTSAIRQVADSSDSSLIEYGSTSRYAEAVPPRNVVIARLLGGLGNQLFQYAAARCIALKKGWRLKLDVNGFDRYRRRTYALGNFRIVEDFASPDDVKLLKRSQIGLLLQKLPFTRQTHIQERHFHYDARMRDIRSGVYLAGYWQSEKYFSDVSDIIRAEFSPKVAPISDTLATLRLIESVNSVSVHVRRGDYVTNPSARRLHGCCSLDYYRYALTVISRRVRDPHYFVFSDDCVWARTNLVIDGPVVFVDFNGVGQDHEDLRLMSKCRHHVIANSTFSWWGAWLAGHPQQVVVAPRRWFASGGNDTSDLYPSGWLQV